MSQFRHLDRKLLLGQTQIKEEVGKDLPDHLLAASYWHKIAFSSWVTCIINNKAEQFCHVACKKQNQNNH